MIQRIQTIYLLLALILTVLLFFSPVTELLTGNNLLLSFKSSGFYNVETNKIIIKTVPLIILIAVIAMLYLTAVFLYKRRVIQARICMLNILLLAGLCGLLLYYLTIVFRKVEITGYSLQFAALFPVLCIILTYMAYRAIHRDEKLVRSADTIR